MKKSLLFLLLFSVVMVAQGQSKDEKKVAAAVEALHKALVAADGNTLRNLTVDELSYGHSGGRIEDKKMFLDSAVSGTFRYVSIDATNQTIKVAKKAAVVRHRLSIKANSNGTPTDLNLGVLQVWQKRGGSWKLLARQAVKL
jgi:ketosteroid isomerase-like protein